MNNKNRSFSPPAVGGSALLVIFAVLCLTVFAMLSLATVQADRRTADAAAQAVQDYYAADSEAEKILAELRTGTLPENVSEANGVYSYACAISDTQTLAVQVQADGANYRILQWQAVSTADWEPETGITVWNGEIGE
jgi:hypothetical protein